MDSNKNQQIQGYPKVMNLSYPPYTNNAPFQAQNAPAYIAANPNIYGNPYAYQVPPAVEVQGRARNYREMYCPTCQCETSSIHTMVNGSTTWKWCVIIGLLTCGGICCFIPFLSDDYKDLNIKCVQCMTVKQVVKAKDCCD